MKVCKFPIIVSFHLLLITHTFIHYQAPTLFVLVSYLWLFLHQLTCTIWYPKSSTITVQSSIIHVCTNRCISKTKYYKVCTYSKSVKILMLSFEIMSLWTAASCTTSIKPSSVEPVESFHCLASVPSWKETVSHVKVSLYTSMLHHSNDDIRMAGRKAYKIH